MNWWMEVLEEVKEGKGRKRDKGGVDDKQVAGVSGLSQWHSDKDGPLQHFSCD